MTFGLVTTGEYWYIPIRKCTFLDLHITRTDSAEELFVVGFGAIFTDLSTTETAGHFGIEQDHEGNSTEGTYSGCSWQ